MRHFESTEVLGPSGSRTSWREIRLGRLLAQNTELPRPIVRGARQSHGIAQNLSEKGCVECAHFGLRTRSYVGRTGSDCLCFRDFPVSQGLECGSSPTSGTVFPQVRGGF